MEMQNITLRFFLENRLVVYDSKSRKKLPGRDLSYTSYVFLSGVFSVHEEDPYDSYVSVNRGVHEHKFSSKGTLCLSDNLVASITQACS